MLRGESCHVFAQEQKQLKEPKTPIGKLVAGAWRKFKEWWDMHKRKEVEEKTRKKCSWQTCGIKERNEGASKDTGCTQKTQGNRVGITFPLIDSDGGMSTIPVQERFYIMCFHIFSLKFRSHLPDRNHPCYR